MDNKLPNTEQDLKIYQLAGYDASKVKAIRELMESDVFNFVEWTEADPNISYTRICKNKWQVVERGVLTFLPVFISDAEIYQRYQQPQP